MSTNALVKTSHHVNLLFSKPGTSTLPLLLGLICQTGRAFAIFEELASERLDMLGRIRIFAKLYITYRHIYYRALWV